MYPPLTTGVRFDALKRIHEFVEMNGTDEQIKRLRRLTGSELGGPPLSYNPAQHDMYTAEALMIALEMHHDNTVAMAQLRETVAALIDSSMPKNPRDD